MTGVRGKPPESTRISVRELAAAFGVSPHTVRHYVRLGLLPPPVAKGPASYYTAVHWQRMKAIRARVADKGRLR